MGFFSVLKKKNSSIGEGTSVDPRRQSEFYGNSRKSAKEVDDDELLPSIKTSFAKSFSHAQRSTRQAPSSLIAAYHGPTVPYTCIAQFSHLQELYSGSVSTVYKATCVQTGLKVVVKAYHKAKMNDRHFHKLDREIALQTAVQDSMYVCKLFAVFEDVDTRYLVLELCEGGDLFKKMLVKGGKLDEAYVCTEILVPLLRVLENMHAVNILHRDIKPENIFLTKEDRFKLGDYGLAIDTTQDIPFCRSGTLDYMSPEVLYNPSTTLHEGSASMEELQTRGIKPYGPKVDIWAAGVLAYELVHGRPPFEVEDESQTVTLILTSNDIHFPKRHSAAWADFCRIALTKKPSKRPNATQLLEHPWIIEHMAAVIGVRNPRPTKELLLDPLPPCRPAEKICAAPEGIRSLRPAVSFMLPHNTASASPVNLPKSYLSSMSTALENLQLESQKDSEGPSLRPLDGKGSVSFTVPADNYTGVNITPLTKEEMGETGAAVGMKARVKFYLNRQRGNS